MNRAAASLRVPRAAVAAAAAIGLALLGGCAGKSGGPASSAAAGPVEGWAGREAVTDAIALLNRGEAEEARRLLAKVLERQPGDMIARRLLDQIEQDPRALLGARHFVYTAREGDSFSALAGRYLGDPMLFYALARYNDLAVPAGPSPGQKLLIPGREPSSAVKKAPVPRQEPKKPAASARAEPAQPSQPAKPAADPARANKLRGMALAAMNGGAIDRAVALLRQAQAANPSDARIKADLARAVRVQSTVQRK